MMQKREKREGYYFGTVVDGKWWKRYKKEGFFARGNGDYWLEEHDFCFRKFLSDKPIRISLQRIDEITTGKWHAGKWGGGLPVIKICWTEKGENLCAGFILANGVEECRRIVEKIRCAAALEDAAEEGD